MSAVIQGALLMCFQKTSAPRSSLVAAPFDTRRLRTSERSSSQTCGYERYDEARWSADRGFKSGSASHDCANDTLTSVFKQSFPSSSVWTTSSGRKPA